MRPATTPTVPPRAPADWLLPFVVALIGQQEVWAPLPGFPHPTSWSWWHAIGYALAAATLCWRRRYPIAVLAIIAAIESVQYLVAGAPEGLATLLPPLIAVFACGRYAPTRDLAIAAPLGLLGIAVHELRDPQFQLDGAAATYWALIATAWPIGYQLRRHFQRAEHATQAVTQHAKAAVVDERARIARDLHDVVGHAVGVIVVQAVAGTAQLDKERYDGVRERLAAIEVTARQALAEMRRLVDVLDVADADSGTSGGGEPPNDVDASLPDLVERVRAAGLDVRFAVVGPSRALPPGINVTIFRVVQEALTNTLKHAGAVTATVTVTYHDEAIEIEILDTGVVTGTTPNGHRGRGLLGMRERVALYGGEVHAAARPGEGFQVHARMPIEQVQA